MRFLIIIGLLLSTGRVCAQEGGQRVRFELGASPSYIGPAEHAEDNWIGTKPAFGTRLDASINWKVRKGGGSVGLGGGLFLWGDRILFPIYGHIVIEPSSLCDDCLLANDFWKRTTVEVDLGMMIGGAETTDGPLRGTFLNNVGLRYRLGDNERSRFSIGVRSSLFGFRGPYRSLSADGWKDGRPAFLTIGPAVWFTF